MLTSRPLTIPTTAAIQQSHRTYLTNRLGSISHHITPLVINSLGDGQTNTHTYTYRCSRTETILRNQACSRWTPGLKIFLYSCILYVLIDHKTCVVMAMLGCVNYIDVNINSQSNVVGATIKAGS